MPEQEPKSTHEKYQEAQASLADKLAAALKAKKKKPAESAEDTSPPAREELPAPPAEPELAAPKETEPETKFKVGDKVFTFYKDPTTGVIEVNRKFAHVIKSVNVRPGRQPSYILDNSEDKVESWLEQAPADAPTMSSPPFAQEAPEAPEVQAVEERPAAPVEMAAEPSKEIDKILEPEPEKVEQVVAETVREVAEEKLKATDLSDDEKRILENIVNNKDRLEKIAERMVGQLKDKKFLGWATTFAVSMAGGMAARAALRHGIEAAFTFSSAGTGAIIGGAMRGFGAWRRSRKEVYNAANWSKEFEGKANVDLAANYEAVKRAIKEKKVRGNQEEALALVSKLRDIGKAIAKNKGSEAVLNQALADDETTDLTGEAEKLYKQMIGDRKWRVAKSVAIEGVVPGLALGYIGGSIGGYLHDYFSGSAEVEDVPTLKEGTRQTLEHLQKKAIDAKMGALAQLTEQAMKELPTQNFTEHVGQGEGTTNVARNFIHDYIVQDRRLNSLPGRQAIHLAREQLIYAEDYLQRQMAGANLQPGQELSLKGEQILEAIEAARNLTGEQLKNLQEKWVGKISDQTWEKIMDYSKAYDSANEFAAEWNKKALAEGQAAFEKVMSEAATPEGVRKGVQEATEAVATAEKNNRTMEFVIYGLGAAGGIAALGVGIKKVIEKRGALDQNKPIDPDFIAKHPPVSETKPKTPFWRREKDKTEQNKKNADPIIAWYQNHGLEANAGDVSYGGITPEDIGEEEAKPINFSNYSDYRQYLESLSPFMRAQALLYEDVGLLASDRFWNQQDKLPKEDLVNLQAEYRKITRGLHEDKYAGKPEATPKTITDLEAVQQSIFEEYEINFYQDYDLDYDANCYAAEKIKPILKNIPKERMYHIAFRPNLKNQLQKSGEIFFNPDTSPAELQKFFELNLDKAAEIMRKNTAAYQILDEVRKNYGIISYTNGVYEDEFVKAAESLRQAVQGMSGLPENMYLQFIPTKDGYLDKSAVNLVWNMTPEEMRTEIQKFLEAKNKEGRPNA